ncbi:MAG TPA: hypothetical protein VIA98_03450 [Allosphingosinicella sp.]|jgi:hypothetical protein
MKNFVALAALALISGCAASADSEANLRADTDVRLAGELSNYRQSGQPVSCVNLRNVRGNHSAGEGAIVFEGTGNRLWVNRPAGGCPDLRGDRTLITRTPSGQLCRGDIVRVTELTSGIDYGSCGLGDFTPYERRRN